jgi:hypothetical protein
MMPAAAGAPAAGTAYDVDVGTPGAVKDAGDKEFLIP